MAPNKNRSSGRRDGDLTSRPDYVRVTDLLLKVGIELNHYRHARGAPERREPADTQSPEAESPPDPAAPAAPGSDAGYGDVALPPGASVPVLAPIPSGTRHLVLVDARLLGEVTVADFERRRRSGVHVAYVSALSDVALLCEGVSADPPLESVAILFHGMPFDGDDAPVHADDANFAAKVRSIRILCSRLDVTGPGAVPNDALVGAFESISALSGRQATQLKVYMYACMLASVPGFRALFARSPIEVLGSVDVTGQARNSHNWRCEWSSRSGADATVDDPPHAHALFDDLDGLALTLQRVFAQAGRAGVAFNAASGLGNAASKPSPLNPTPPVRYGDGPKNKRPEPGLTAWCSEERMERGFWVDKDGYAEVKDALYGRCAVCHARFKHNGRYP
jgi:hypothetical protein